jgi:hypothetical protein
VFSRGGHAERVPAARLIAKLQIEVCSIVKLDIEGALRAQSETLCFRAAATRSACPLRA